MKGWYGDRQKHSMASKGIKTKSISQQTNIYKCGNCNSKMRFVKSDEEDYWSCPNCGKMYYDYSEIHYIGKGKGMHGYLDRSWDEHIFKDIDMEDIRVVVFNEPDWESIREEYIFEHISDSEWDKITDKEEEQFSKEGEVHVIWAGAVDFMGTEIEFAKQYPELNKHLGLGLGADGLLDTIVGGLIPYFMDSVTKKEEKK